MTPDQGHIPWWRKNQIGAVEHSKMHCALSQGNLNGMELPTKGTPSLVDFSTTSFLPCTLCWWQSCCPATLARALMLTRWGALPAAGCTYFTFCPADTCPGLVRELESDLLKTHPASLAFEMLAHSLSALNLSLSRLNLQHANIPQGVGRWGVPARMSFLMVSSTHVTHFWLPCARLVFLIVWKGRVKYGTKIKKDLGWGVHGPWLPHATSRAQPGGREESPGNLTETPPGTSDLRKKKQTDYGNYCRRTLWISFFFFPYQMLLWISSTHSWATGTMSLQPPS